MPALFDRQDESNLTLAEVDSSSGSPMVTIQGVTKRFGDRVAVNGVSLSIERGEIFGLLGPNGAGKSTTVNMLSTFMKPDSGEITIGGFPFRDTARIKRMIGVVPQELAVYDDLTATQNGEFFARIYGVDRNRRKARILEVLDLVGLEERMGDTVEAFSGGMKRRLNLALGLLHKPAFIMLDEPTVGVDPQSRQRIFDIIRDLKNQGTTILYTTHYMEEAEQLCDHIAIMDDGQVIAKGTLDELLRLRIEEAIVERPRGLEQLFIQLTGKRLRD
ncbi:MAG TPA: ABC transporter ATP-binding protein [Chloroflexota bacterium]|nr:ABC transporter ATP-binding protein [Chloroflexota bacterium]